MTIGKRIRKERLSRGLSQEELAKALSTTKQAIYKYETEIVTNIPMDKIEKLAELFNTTPSYLMGWDDVPDEPQLTEDERLLLELYRSCSEDAKKLTVAMLENFENQPEDVKRMLLGMIRAAFDNQQ